jgi:uncharacterized protein (DUF1684 family)
MKKFFLAGILLLFLLPGCNKVEQAKDRAQTLGSRSTPIFRTAEDERRYIREMQFFRAEKDSFLKTSPKSPIKKEERRSFKGLKYYGVEPAFVVNARLLKNENPAPITITTTTGTNRSAIKYGYLDFSLGGKTHKLGAYKFSDQRDKSSKEYLFVPFTDSTSGRETYGAGRYIDLEENESGDYILDFNRAYNPYCAYNEDYSCPIPPRENRLSLSVTAGEKVYH